jgi:hypothetical protein
MKILRLLLLVAAAAGTFLATSCCKSTPAPTPTAPTYIAPTK